MLIEKNCLSFDQLAVVFKCFFVQFEVKMRALDANIYNLPRHLLTQRRAQQREEKPVFGQIVVMNDND